MGRGTSPTQKWDGLWLTLPKAAGLINLKPRGRKRGRSRHNVRRMVETLQSASDRNAFAPSYPPPHAGKVGRGRPVVCCGFLNQRTKMPWAADFLMTQRR